MVERVGNVWNAVIGRWLVVLALAGMVLPSLATAEELPELVDYRKECESGMTIYCLTLGMEAEKNEQWTEAFDWYRLACENHLSHGHLRACTPYFSVAKRLGRLRQATVPFENRCRSDGNLHCFYLAKEYLKIGEFEPAYKKFRALCEEAYYPPDREDYGPCFHWARSLEERGKLEEARDLYRAECHRNTRFAAKNCHRLEKVNQALAIGEKTREPESLQAFRAGEIALILIVVLPVVAVMFYLRRWRASWWMLKFPLPAMTLCCWALWEVEAGRWTRARDDLVFIIPAMVVVGWTAILAHRRDGVLRLPPTDPSWPY